MSSSCKRGASRRRQHARAALGSALCALPLLVVTRYGPLLAYEDRLLHAILSVCAVWLGIRGMWRSRAPERYVALGAVVVGLVGCYALLRPTIGRCGGDPSRWSEETHVHVILPEFLRSRSPG